MIKKTDLKKVSLIAAVLIGQALSSDAQISPVFDKSQKGRTEATVRKLITPVRILWQAGQVNNALHLLKQGNGQPEIAEYPVCTLTNKDTARSGLLLDFGKELHGGLQLVTDRYKGGKPTKVRIRFGESAAEAMSDIDTIKNATNDHAMRDYVVTLPWLGKFEVGNTGFRFVRIDLVDSNTELKFKEISAIMVYRDIPYLGSFNCSDTLLNKIWMTGAYTVHLNMQDYLWDGIKRDRLVWIGDMHPETSTISVVFGNNNVVPKSLDLARDITPLPDYMNGIVSYSMWWVLIQRDWYLHTGDLKYLHQQKTYLVKLLEHYLTNIDQTGNEHLNDGWRFLDWPSSKDPKAIHAGLQAMLIMTLDAGADLCKTLDDPLTAKKCIEAIAHLKKNVPDAGDSKQAAALMALSGLLPAQKANEVISEGGVQNYSTFFGYYMLLAKAKAGDYQGGINAIKNYWGPMLALGATTFWEDFNINWMPNAARIDELVPQGKTDLHAKYGDFSYKGYRNSLAHGWSSGPTPWLTEYVLGVKVMAPGCRVIKIEPHLGDLSFAEGTFPTPYGIVKIKHTKGANGKIRTVVTGPKMVRIIK
jgi:alpha-L-rhamnosidase